MYKCQILRLHASIFKDHSRGSWVLHVMAIEIFNFSDKYKKLKLRNIFIGNVFENKCNNNNDK